MPIGQLSEEAQEARNKDFRKYREDFSRKMSRKVTMEDVFNRLLVSSDPYISSMRNLPKKGLKTYSKEVLDLLQPPDYNLDTEENINDSSSDSEYNSSTDSSD